MTRAKSLESYPPLFWDIIDRVALKKETLALTVADQRVAMRMQGKFYAFRGALMREIDRITAHPDRYTGADMDRIQEAYKLSCMVVFWRERADVSPVRVRFLHRDNTDDNKLLAAMLAGGEAGGASDAARIAESEEKLKGLLAGQAGGKKNDYY